MIRNFSQPVRRIIAIGMLLFLLLLAIAAAQGLARSVGEALGGLGDARFRSARLAALAQRPPSPPGQPVPRDMLFRAPTAEAAQAELAGRIVAAAASTQVTLDAPAPLPPDPRKPALVSLSLAAAGPEQAVLSFVSQLEQGRPAIRFSRWSLTASGDNMLRFQATAAAGWEKAR